MGHALWQLALAVAISLVGATLNAAIMGDNRFFLEADIYRGVKLTFVLPVLLTFSCSCRKTTSSTAAATLSTCGPRPW